MNEEFTYKYVRLKLKGGTWTGRFDNEYQGAGFLYECTGVNTA